MLAVMVGGALLLTGFTATSITDLGIDPLFATALLVVTLGGLYVYYRIGQERLSRA